MVGPALSIDRLMTSTTQWTNLCLQGTVLSISSVTEAAIPSRWYCWVHTGNNKEHSAGSHSWNTVWWFDSLEIHDLGQKSWVKPQCYHRVIWLQGKLITIAWSSCTLSAEAIANKCFYRHPVQICILSRKDSSTRWRTHILLTGNYRG